MDRIPILRMGQCLLVTIQVDMQDQTALALQDDLSEKIQSTGANGVLIDIITPIPPTGEFAALYAEGEAPAA